jgi:pSer/pThr/pTyr-binding forkhead associated (FHA) protein
VIGRSGDCDVVVADPKVSNRHCEMALIHGQVLIYDLDSTNRTYVNGVPIRGRDRLETRDMILVGDTEMRLHFEET